MSNALETWQIENVALNMPIEQLQEVPTPFLAFLNTEGGSYCLVQKIEIDTIEWLHDKKGLKREKLTDFAKTYKGTILVAEANEQSGESNYAENKRKEWLDSLRLPLALVSVFFMVLTGFYFVSKTADIWQVYALASAKLVGVIVSVFLLWHQIDKNNAFVKNLCQVGKKANCDAILNSKVANLFSWLSWAEIGFFYFAGTLLALFTNTKALPLLGLFTLLALPYTLYSLYYQVFVAKQYCILCLAVVGLLWIEILIQLLLPKSFPFWEGLTNSLSFGGAVHTEGWGRAILSFLIPITFWIFIKPFFIKSVQVEPLKAQLRRFKNNPELFERLLTMQESMPYLSVETVIVGNPNAENTLTMITIPFCPPCAKTHLQIEQLIEKNKNLNCQVVFTATNEETDKRGEVAKHILSLAEDQREEALHTWCLADKQDIKAWKAQFTKKKR